jgi:hypothetical protein
MVRRAACGAGLALVLMGGATPLAAEEATWKVTRLVDHYYETCDGGRGSIRVKGDELAYYDQGMPYPAWNDNSAGEYIHTNRRLRVKIAAGAGPRMITTFSEQNLCAYKYVPD